MAWCELRHDFRAFRIDRIATMDPTGRVFRPERGKQLADFYRRMERAEKTNGAAPTPCLKEGHRGRVGGSPPPSGSGAAPSLRRGCAPDHEGCRGRRRLRVAPVSGSRAPTSRRRHPGTRCGPGIQTRMVNVRRSPSPGPETFPQSIHVPAHLPHTPSAPDTKRRRWTEARAIEANRIALKRIVAMLVEMAGLDEDARTIPRILWRAILALLRPAESAARRLVIATARGLVCPLCPPRRQPEARKPWNRCSAALASPSQGRQACPR